MAGVLEVSGVRKVYGDRAVVDDVSFHLNAGEVLGLLGPNGAGKTTIVGMLYGVIDPTSGTVRYSQSGVGLEGGLFLPRDGRAIRRALGVVPQTDNLDRDFPVEENLIQFAHHYGISGAPARRRVREVLERLRIVEHARKTPFELSGGIKRRVVLARALLADPMILFLDEPTTGLDPDARQDFGRVVQELRAEGRAILLTTHYMEEARRLCDRLIILQRGRVVDQGLPEEMVVKLVGAEVLEVTGGEESAVTALVAKHNAWIRKFGTGFVCGLPEGELLWQELRRVPGVQIVRRPGNLEDVFLILTGDRL